MRIFIFGSMICLLMLITVSCNNDIIDQKLYYGYYESVNHCNKESVELLTNGTYRYKFIHQNKLIYTYQAKYHAEADNSSDKKIVFIVFNDWKNAVNPNYKDNLIKDCNGINFNKQRFVKSDAVYFQISKEGDSFWSRSKNLVIERHPDYQQYDFIKK